MRSARYRGAGIDLWGGRANCGFPGRARQAGFALRVAPKELHLPWHRVVGAGGRIVFPKFSAEHKEQARRLRAEGVLIQNGRVARFMSTRLDER